MNVIVSDAMNAECLRAQLKQHIEQTEYRENLERTRLTMISYLSGVRWKSSRRLSETGVLRRPEERDLAILFYRPPWLHRAFEEMEPVWPVQAGEQAARPPGETHQ
jgi:hypothetical protein